MSMNRYQKGDNVRCLATFTNVSTGAVADPSTVTFSVRSPSGVITTYTYGTDAEVVKSSTGVYYVMVDANEVGIWHYRFASTGTGKAADEEKFEVEPSVF